MAMTGRDRSVGTSWNNLLISSDLLQVVLSDLLSLVSIKQVCSGLFQQVATALLSTACDRPVPASLLPPDETNS
jgi:hypothetical protein